MIPITAIIEEFEQGAWVADLTSTERFTDSFETLGITWTGTAVSVREEFEVFHTRVVGGKAKLATLLKDKYYDGRVRLEAAVQDVCRESGETFGSTILAASLTSFERIRGTASEALDALAEVFQALWWIGRDGKVQLKVARDSSADAQGIRTSSDVDSVLLSDPVLQIGSAYDGKTVRHIRWELTPQDFTARLYFVPFLFRNPTRTAYSSLMTASVDKQNADGSLDVIVSGRFGVTNVPLLSGIPGSKIKVNGGEQVTLGFFGGNPQAPFCLAHGQDAAATKQVARKGDSVNAGTLTAVSTPGGGPVTFVYVGANGVPSAPSQTASLTGGEVTSGSERVKLGD